MSEWRELIRQKAAKGGRLNDHERAALEEARMPEIVRRMEPDNLGTALLDLRRGIEAAIHKAFNLTGRR